MLAVINFFQIEKVLKEVVFSGISSYTFRPSTSGILIEKGLYLSDIELGIGIAQT